jgi:hypothetical protein
MILKICLKINRNLLYLLQMIHRCENYNTEVKAKKNERNVKKTLFFPE